jgi:hypothetical protein
MHIHHLDALLKEHLKIWKNKWKLLQCISNFSYDKQVKIVMAFMALKALPKYATVNFHI